MLQNLAQTALIGTARATPSVSTLEMLETWGIATDDLAEAVLLGAIATDLAQKTGYEAAIFEGQIPQKAAIGTEKIMTNAIIKYLKIMLSGRYTEAFFEFLCLCLQHQYCIAPEYLPQILEHKMTKNIPKNVLKQAIGQCGEWLLNQNKAWAKAIVAKQENAEDAILFSQLNNTETLDGFAEIMQKSTGFQMQTTDFVKKTTLFAYTANTACLDNMSLSAEGMRTQSGVCENVLHIVRWRKEMQKSFSA